MRGFPESYNEPVSELSATGQNHMIAPLPTALAPADREEE